jgi:hypothetical protein
VKQLFWRVVAIITIAIPVVLVAIPDIGPIWRKELEAPARATPNVIFFVVVSLAFVIWKIRPKRTKFFVTLVHKLGHSHPAALVGGASPQVFDAHIFLNN